MYSNSLSNAICWSKNIAALLKSALPKSALLVFSLSNAGFRCFKSDLFKEKSALLKKIFNVDENLNNADFSLSNAQGPQNGFYLGEARKFFI